MINSINFKQKKINTNLWWFMRNMKVAIKAEKKINYAGYASFMQCRHLHARMNPHWEKAFYCLNETRRYTFRHGCFEKLIFLFSFFITHFLHLRFTLLNVTIIISNKLPRKIIIWGNIFQFYDFVSFRSILNTSQVWYFLPYKSQ